MFDVALNIFMRKIITFILFFSLTGTFAGAKSVADKFERSVFYAAMKTGDLNAVNNQIEMVKAADINGKEGFEGALLMKKAGLLKRPKERLRFFKEGRIKLETALQASDDNTELHFLRLLIEEHAPKIVKYHSDLDKDKAAVIKNYKSLPPVVQHAVLDYAKDSKVLNPEDFSPRSRE